MFSNREKEAKREKDRERKAKYAFLVATIRDEIQPCPSHPRPGLILCSHPRTLLLMHPAGILGKGVPEPTAPLKSMHDLWPVGTLEDGLRSLAPKL